MLDIKVSIVIPVYNLEQYIGKCIESVLCQSFTAWEAIIVNDGSVDNSLSVCLKYAQKDKRLIVINQSNKGVSAARKTGVDSARGKWVTFLDGDDVLPVDSLSYMYYKSEVLGIDIFIGNQYYINRNKRSRSYKNVGVFSKDEYSKIVSDYHILMGLRGKLIKRQLLLICPLEIDRKIVNNEDILITIFMTEHVNNVYITNKPVYGYLLREGSAAHKTYPISYWEMYFDYFAELRQKYTISDEVYIRSKITKLCSLTRNYNGLYDFDFSSERFNDIREYNNFNLGFYRSILLIICKTNLKFLVKILRIHKIR